MKKLFIYLSVLFSTTLFFGQNYGGLVYVGGPNGVEVGSTNNYQFTFIPSPPSQSQGQAPIVSYHLNFWSISATTSGSIISGSLNNSIDAYNTYINMPLGQSSFPNDRTTIYVPIKFGDNAFRYSPITVFCGGFYKDSNGISYPFTTATEILTVAVLKVKTPTISNPTYLACCNNNLQFCASDFDDANSFAWTVTGGSIVSGQSSTCITVAPTSSGTVSASCFVKRTTGLPNYTATGSRTVSPASRTVTYFNTTSNQYYMCKSAPLTFQIEDQCGINSVTWNAPNCTISGETISNGKRQVTILPNSSIPVGASVVVNATANFSAGCTATSPSVTYPVYDSSSPIIPTGTLGGNNTPTGAQNPAFYTFKFTPSGTFNGIVTLDPSEVVREEVGFTQSVNVCYFNPCTGTSNCKIFTKFVTGRGNKPGTMWRVAQNETPIKVLVTPNPTRGNVKVSLPEINSGVYEIFDQNGILYQTEKFQNVKELEIDLSNKLKSGIYVLKINTENDTFTEKIILNK